MSGGWILVCFMAGGVLGLLVLSFYAEEVFDFLDGLADRVRGL